MICRMPLLLRPLLLPKSNLALDLGCRENRRHKLRNLVRREALPLLSVAALGTPHQGPICTLSVPLLEIALLNHALQLLLEVLLDNLRRRRLLRGPWRHLLHSPKRSPSS